MQVFESTGLLETMRVLLLSFCCRRPQRDDAVATEEQGAFVYFFKANRLLTLPIVEALTILRAWRTLGILRIPGLSSWRIAFVGLIAAMAAAAAKAVVVAVAAVVVAAA